MGNDPTRSIAAPAAAVSGDHSDIAVTVQVHEGVQIASIHAERFEDLARGLTHKPVEGGHGSAVLDDPEQRQGRGGLGVAETAR